MWLALGLAACGDVNVIPDAAVPDAYQHDAANDPMCGADEMACSGLCANVMTSETYCGNCTTSCAPNQGCVAGACVPNFTNCARIKEVDPAAADGLYTNPNTGVFFYCDFAGSNTYDDFRLGVFSTTPAGYTLARATDFQDPVFASAFIAFFNRLGGLRANATFTAGNCCMTTIAGSRLQFGAQFVFPGVGTAATSCAFNFTVDAVYTLSRNQSSMYISVLPPDYFTVNAPGELAGCTDGTNPAIFYKRRAGLN